MAIGWRECGRCTRGVSEVIEGKEMRMIQKKAKGRMDVKRRLLKREEEEK